VAVLVTKETIDSASDRDIRAACKLLLIEKAIWERRTEAHEKRSTGLDEMLHELVEMIKHILIRQKQELERIARIAAEAVTVMGKRADELEEL
jgi:hypothetical protein